MKMNSAGMGSSRRRISSKGARCCPQRTKGQALHNKEMCGHASLLA
ncbi:hypothetical protein OIU77_014091 [Salix suchowensis]|uniref:Uncharacterized protein n=1 Tax=Salix suchowensis TaxID=1278906 RepID=A0ABQ8ZW46_9ROSI|nr:hypothetical protein OIU77_014091 [Salix suchowensis]